MPLNSIKTAQAGGIWESLSEVVASDGSGSHPHLRALEGTSGPLRELADAVHLVCWLHGHQPGLIDHARSTSRQIVAADWLSQAATAFVAERTYLVRLTAAAGPLPSTPGQAQSEAAVTAQHHALSMLAQSDRTGCAIGAAVALMLDWSAIRAVLDTAGYRLGIETPEPPFPTEAATEAMVAAVAEAPGAERALRFGAQQMLAQHRGLWDLIEARASAREPI